VVLVSPERCTKASIDLLRPAGINVMLLGDGASKMGMNLALDQRWVGQGAKTGTDVSDR
jgi:hypothetical protein